jgi:hypothetical protein
LVEAVVRGRHLEHEHRLLDLARLHWLKTRAREDFQGLLSANPFRRLTLDNGGAAPSETGSYGRV